MNQKIVPSHLIHKAFRVGIFLKGLNGLLETLSGVLLFVVSLETINGIVRFLTAGELKEDPLDFFSNYAIHSLEHFSASEQLFTAYYLTSHGVIKLFLVVALWKRKLWAYPLAIFFFVAFILYQTYLFIGQPSFVLVALTIFDLAIIVLTYLEYQQINTSQQS